MSLLAGSIALAMVLAAEQLLMQRQVAADGSEALPVLARKLAAAGIPAGFVLRRSDAMAPAARGGGAAAPGRTVGEVVRGLEQRHPAYQARDIDGSLMVAPRSESVCAAALAGPVSRPQFQGAARLALFRLMREIHPDIPDIEPGMLSGGGGGDGQRILQTPVMLPTAKTTIGATLFDIVRQVPGLVWATVETPDQNRGRPRCVMLWYYESGTAFTSYDISPAK